MMSRPMTVFPVLAVLLLSLLGSGPSQAGSAATEIESTLDRWMADFNAGKTEQICDLFAADVRADYRGYPTRDHQAVCDLLIKSPVSYTHLTLPTILLV